QEYRMKSNIISIKLVMTMLLFGCLLPMPYGYFQLVRVIGMVGFALLAYYEKDKADKTCQIVWICSAILINPVFKFSLGRTLWNVVDVIWAILLLVTTITDYRKARTTKKY